MPHALIPQFSAVWIMQALSAAFLAVLFLQSSIDKLVDRRGNLDFLIGHFAKSPLASTVRPMFLVITVLELAAGVLSGVGAVMVVCLSHSDVAFWGAVVAGCALTALFFGQRVAKDYAGAAALVPYFLLTLVTIYVQSL
jgi:hypothetical protein